MLRSRRCCPPYDPAVPRISSAVAQAARVVGLSVDDGSEHTIDSAARPIDMGHEIVDHNRRRGRAVPHQVSFGDR